MNPPDDTLHVAIEYYDGQDEDDVGYAYYVASCDQIGAVTDGRTLDELFRNLREVIELAFEEEDTVAVYNVVPNPRISITMELPDYAQIA
jgi:predicted RNase H-like HicB family nuclease